MDKDLSGEVLFVVATNEGISAELRPLLPEADSSSRADIVENLERRLAGLRPPSGRSLRWCLERLTIETAETTADALEAQLLREFNTVLAAHDVALLQEEAEELLSKLMAHISSEARRENSRPLNRSDFADFLLQAAERLSEETANRRGAGAPSFRDKMLAAGFTDAQISDMERMRSKFAQYRRHSVSDQRTLIDRLSDEVSVACHHVIARRHSGDVPAGAAAYSATVEALRPIHVSFQRLLPDFDWTLAHGALHDITARCGNQYV